MKLNPQELALVQKSLRSNWIYALACALAVGGVHLIFKSLDSGYPLLLQCALVHLAVYFATRERSVLENLRAQAELQEARNSPTTTTPAS